MQAEGSRRQHIVVGADGSAPSRAALTWAIRQARLTGAAVDAVIAWHQPTVCRYPLPIAPETSARELPHACSSRRSTKSRRIWTGMPRSCLRSAPRPQPLISRLHSDFYAERGRRPGHRREELIVGRVEQLEYELVPSLLTGQQLEEPPGPLQAAGPRVVDHEQWRVGETADDPDVVDQFLR